MLDERQIKEAFEQDASQIEPPPDLLKRIHHEAARLSPTRPILWARLSPKLEILVACILVATLIGAGAFRQFQKGPAPAGKDAPVEANEPAPAKTAEQVFSGEATDGTLRVELVLRHQPPGEWNIFATFQNLAGYAIEVTGGCDLVSITGLGRHPIVKSCPMAHSLLEPGGTAQTAFVVPAQGADLPEAGTVRYLIRSEGPTDPSRSLPVPLQVGALITRDAPDLMEILHQAGLQAEVTEELSTRLFGAKRVERIIVEGVPLIVYVFDGIVSADHGWQTMTNAERNTVSWANEPQFVQLGNLIVQIEVRHRILAERIKAAFESQPPESKRPLRSCSMSGGACGDFGRLN